MTQEELEGEERERENDENTVLTRNSLKKMINKEIGGLWCR